jgi:Molybdopterin oxidoreductase
MIIGSNPRREAPVLNARIRKRWRHSNLKIGVIGERADLTYDYTYLGAGTDTLASFLEHEPADLKRQIWLVGQGALTRPDGVAVLSAVAKAAVATGALVDGWNGFSVLHTAAARVMRREASHVLRKAPGSMTDCVGRHSRQHNTAGWSGNDRLRGFGDGASRLLLRRGPFLLDQRRARRVAAIALVDHAPLAGVERRARRVAAVALVDHTLGGARNRGRQRSRQRDGSEASQ